MKISSQSLRMRLIAAFIALITVMISLSGCGQTAEERFYAAKKGLSSPCPELVLAINKKIQEATGAKDSYISVFTDGGIIAAFSAVCLFNDGSVKSYRVGRLSAEGTFLYYGHYATYNYEDLVHGVYCKTVNVSGNEIIF